MAEREVVSRSWCSLMLYTASDGRRDESDGPRDCDDGRTRRGRVATVQRQRESIQYNIVVSSYLSITPFTRLPQTWSSLKLSGPKRPLLSTRPPPAPNSAESVDDQPIFCVGIIIIIIIILLLYYARDIIILC